MALLKANEIIGEAEKPPIDKSEEPEAAPDQTLSM
jgi:hypothetical protein